MKHVEFKQMESDPEHSSSRCCLNKKVKTWFLLKLHYNNLRLHNEILLKLGVHISICYPGKMSTQCILLGTPSR